MKQFKLAIFFLFLTTLTHASSPHTHGEATASIIIENKKVSIALSIPSESVVGFEHSPTTDDEVQQIQAATKNGNPVLYLSFINYLAFLKIKQTYNQLNVLLKLTHLKKNKLPNITIIMTMIMIMIRLKLSKNLIPNLIFK